jgi:hypothetical protein
MNNLILMVKFGINKRSNRIFTTKATDYSESYSTAFPSYTVHSKQYTRDNNKEKEKIVHSGGFKRNHDDTEIKSKLDSKNEQWYPTQLNSNEDYKNMKLGDEGNGSKIFPYKYGNSFWDPHNYN